MPRGKKPPSEEVAQSIAPPSKVYLGWDIGIKNLAFCLITPATSSTSNAVCFGTNWYSVMDWGVINLISQVNENMSADGAITNMHTDEILCCHQIKMDKKCTAKAKLVDHSKMPDGTYRGYCANHAKKLDAATVKLVSLANKKCTSTDCATKGKFCLRDHHYILYCGKHQKEMIKSSSKTEEDFLAIQNSKKSSTINLTQLGKAIMTELDKRPHLAKANIVLLENQPVLKNPTMKSVQMFLYSYFIMRGMIGTERPVEDVLCYTASNKIEIKKLLPDTTGKQLAERLAKIKDQYRQNKETAIFLAEHYMNTNPKWGAMWSSSKKQDDLADSLLMTIHYLEKPNLKKIKN
jgi:hypothetical protein